jgi:hypothetical protein
MIDQIHAYRFPCTKRIIVIMFVVLVCLQTVVGQPSKNLQLPHIAYNNGKPVLMVQGKPFIALGGELGNSTASNAAYMRSHWPVLKQMHLNTVLTPVYWELMEPKEGIFDFSLVDSAIAIARQNNVHLVFLWFGTWKNSMSCYVPEWVKTNPSRFERTIGKDGKTIEILSAFDVNIVQADCKAYAALMNHIKQVDAIKQTVVMMQVENEVGMLPTAREHTSKANALFNAAVPNQLMDLINTNRSKLVPEMKAVLDMQGNKTTGTWAEVFGEGLHTDEIFQAWYYAKFVEQVTKAGKQAYTIPMYVNAALNRPGWVPGRYPSAGPLPHLMDVWKAAAPSVDMLSPDFYNPDTKHWCNLYDRNNNILFVPEMHFETSCAAKALYIIGHHGSLGFSPFSIENGKEKEVYALKNAYSILHQLQPILYGNPLKVDGYLFEKGQKKDSSTFGKYKVNVSHELTTGWNPASKDSVWDATGGIVIQTAEDEFIVAGTGVVVTFQHNDTSVVTNLLTVDEGQFINNKWTAGRRMNGDEDHQGRHVRIAFNDWGIQKVKLYNTKQ